jgi:diaminohydroxyphosphoribosylaminopyrimidine deaminase/5-amino-6-(5-phosphoribosylamino)uracil reductase
VELAPRESAAARPALASAGTTRAEAANAGSPGRDEAAAAVPLDLLRVLARLAEAQMNEVHVEAGPTLAGALIREELADELLIYAAPVLLGPQGRPLADLPRIEALEDAPRFEIIESVSIGPDLRVRLRSRPGADARRA